MEDVLVKIVEEFISIRNDITFENYTKGNIPLQHKEELFNIANKFKNNINQTLIDKYKNEVVVMMGTYSNCLDEMLITAYGVVWGIICNYRENEEYLMLIKDDNNFNYLSSFTEIMNKINEDGLVDTEIFKPHKYALEYKGLIFQLNKQLPYYLQERLCSLAKKQKIKVRLENSPPIKLVNYLEPLYEAKYFGPVLNEKTFFERLKNGRTRSIYQREFKTKEDELYKGFASIYQILQIFRDEQKNRAAYTLEGLPILEKQNDNVKYIKTPLFHSDFDFGNKHFSHIDHSMLIYNIDTYKERLTKGDKEKIKAQGHYKLFYIKDSSLSTWIKLSRDVFYMSELLHHFLTGEEIGIHDFILLKGNKEI